MELHAQKSAHARELSVKADLADDGVRIIADLPTGVDFVLVDLWKDLDVPCLEAFYSKLNPSAILIADKIIHPNEGGAHHYA